MNAQLLPCPFCGCTEIEDKRDDGAHWNRCTRCGSTGPLTTRYSGEEGEEFDSWNTRALQSAGEPVAPMFSRFRHNNGVICCGTLRIARADFDTDPSPEVQKELLDALCYGPSSRLAEIEVLLARYITGECCCPKKDNPHPDAGHFPGCPMLAKEEIARLEDFTKTCINQTAKLSEQLVELGAVIASAPVEAIELGAQTASEKVSPLFQIAMQTAQAMRAATRASQSPAAGAQKCVCAMKKGPEPICSKFTPGPRHPHLCGTEMPDHTLCTHRAACHQHAASAEQK